MGTDDVRRVAALIQTIGDDVRGLAERTLTGGAAHWRSSAADAFRGRLAEEVAAIRAAARCLDDTASALRRHAAAVDRAPAGMPGLPEPGDLIGSLAPGGRIGGPR
jgi:hypothetical protein